MRIDLNCDLGESFGPWPMGADAEMLALVSSANVACGFHGGDPDVMLQTVKLAKANNVAIGAHPGFQDLQGFGRRRILGLSNSEVETMTAYQIGALLGIAALGGHKVTHAKPHGAFSNMACEDDSFAEAVARAVKAVDPNLIFVVIPLSALERAGEKLGMRIAREIFADRTYLDDGMLTPRSMKGSLLHDPALVGERTLRMVVDRELVSINGKKIPIRADTICIHGDNAAAVSLGRAVRKTLVENGVSIEPLHTFV